MRITATLFVCLLGSYVAKAQESCPNPAEDAKTALCYHEQGRFYSDKFEPKAAIAAYDRAVGIWNKLGPDYSHHRAATLVNLGEAYEQESRWNEAAQVYAEALAIHRKQLGPSHERTVLSLARLGGAQLMLGELDAAEKTLTEARELSKALGPASPEKALTLNALATLYGYRADYERAKPLLQEVLRMLDDGAKVREPIFGTAALNLAAMYVLEDDTARAAPLLRRARELTIEYYGPSNPRLARITQLEGVCAMREAKWVTAERLLTGSLTEADKWFGEGSFQSALARNSLAQVYLYQNKTKDAGRFAEAALRNLRTIQPAPDREVAGVLQTLAEVRAAERKYKEAGKIYEEAIALFTETAGPSSPQVARVLNEYAQVAKEDGDRKLERSLKQRVKSISSFR